MKATNRRLEELINGRRQFIVPVFQRDYSWTTEECDQMWKDILRATDSGGGHFLGQIVYVEGDMSAAFQSWLLIDGQQRLTSVTLLLAALRDHIAETGFSGGSVDSPSIEKIEAYFLKNLLEKGDRSYKLMLRRTDNATLRAFVDGKSPPEPNDRSALIVDAYECFKNHLRDSGSDPDTVYRGVNKLTIIEVTLEHLIDDPQLVFESMNFTGVHLSQSDLVRNYLLMGLNEEEQTRLYGDYWRKIEDLFKKSGDAFDCFIRDYIAMRKESAQQTRADRIYEDFKSFWPRDDGSPIEILLQDMTRFARHYASFRGLAPIQPKRLSDSMSNMRQLGTTQGVLIMRLYHLYDEGRFTQEDFINAITLIESYILRRVIVGRPARDYWSVCARVAYAMQSDFGSLRVALARLRDNNRFPEDDEFISALGDRDLYALRICKHILNRLENAGQRELSPVGDYSIEHVMPQAIENSPSWQHMLGGDWRDIHNTWLHRLGNLTLTAYNTRYSNKSFDDKKKIKGGFKQSAIRLNGYIAEQDKWTATEMQERSSCLTRRAPEIWPNHGANLTQLQKAQMDDLRNQAKQRDSDSLEMSEPVRELLHKILDAVRGLGDIVVGLTLPTPR